MKKYLLPLVAILMLFSACKERKNSEFTLTSILTSQTKWRVIEAQFGDELAPVSMYQNFSITFKADGTYTIENPDGAPNFNRNNANNFGTWTELNSALVLDNAVTMKEVGSMVPNRLVFAWDVTLPGKATTTYRFVLAPM